jgi:hypothetical protein
MNFNVETATAYKLNGSWTLDKKELVVEVIREQSRLNGVLLSYDQTRWLIKNLETLQAIRTHVLIDAETKEFANITA